jgi:UV DNA damage endonuclease
MSVADIDGVGLRPGYACVNTLFQSPARTVRLANATPERLGDLLLANLATLESILRWNVSHDIRVFRLSSGTVPFASHPQARFSWRECGGRRFAELGKIMHDGTMRLSTHPGPYTVVASANEAAAAAAVAELDYHAELMTALGLGTSHKIALHLGGGAKDRGAWRRRFEDAVERLSLSVRSRLALENDERWSLAETLEVALDLGLPVVFDRFHHELHPSFPELGVRELVQLAGVTWGAADGRQEVHFSTQAPGRRSGAHADTLDLGAFEPFAADVGDLPLDCVLEVKDKEQSVLRARRVLQRVGR